MNYPICVAGVCTGCPFRNVTCKQKEPTINTMLRKEGLLITYLEHQRPRDVDQLEKELDTFDPLAPRYENLSR
jgi:hypothetical protein